ncbi:complement factor H-like isoform 2-T2 [Clarias gariepinus]
MGSNMDATTKIFFVAFLLSFFTLAKNQECLKKDIDFENTLRSGLEDSYPHKATVRLSCATGFVGSLKIECNNGRWEKTGGRDCKKRPCGHPGDTPNGDFRLTKELEFVFGATVEYTCRTGYVMASRVNYRNCRSQGWDNAVPVCEVVRCPVISSLGDVIATGNTEEASYGDVIHFECESPNKMLDGPQDINCKDNGQWSGMVPKCKEIECRAPKIHNGSTDYNRVYRDNEIMKYTCDSKYKQRAGNPRCTKYGWSIPPECEEITCLLGARTSGIASTSPPGKNIFKVGEYVTITCEKNYRIFWTTQVSQQIKCQDNGKFESSTVCEEITCGYPRGQHLSYPSEYYYTSKQYKLRQSIQYRCERGYKETATHATCTENGWNPELLCTEMTCEYPRGQHMLPPSGQYIKRYKLKESIQYQCEDGYKGTAATCTENGWEPKPQCTEQEKTACEKPFVQNWFITQEKNKEYFYTCGSGYKPFDEKWWEVLSCSNEQQRNPPLCIPDDQCGQIPDIHSKHFQEKKGYENEAILKFDCKPEPCCFKCINGNWEKEDCKSTSCGTPPYVENAAIKFNSEQEVKYLCQEKFEINGNQIIFCTNDEWDQTPTCKQLESDTKQGCSAPEKERNNAILKEPDLKENYQEGDTVEYSCKGGIGFQDGSQATCFKGQWKYPECIQTCPDPERKINNATMVRKNLKATYQDGDTLEYKCIKDFQNEFLNETQAICSKGQWNYPRCIHSCPEPEGEKNNATLVRKNLKMTYQDGDTLKYKCIEDFQNEFQNETQAICSKGQWNYPQCINPFISEK